MYTGCRKASNLTQRLTLSEKTALAQMGRAYDVMENSWLDLGETSRQFLGGDKPASEVVRSMENLQSKKNIVPEHVMRWMKPRRTPLICLVCVLSSYFCFVLKQRPISRRTNC